MLRIALTAAVFAASCLPSAAAIIEYRGALCITKITTACTAGGWGVGDCLLMRYSPPNLGTNGVKTELTVLGQAFGDNYSLATGTLIGTIMKPVAAVHVGREGYAFDATARFSSQSPSAPTATTQTLSVRGVISNFGDTTGCTVNFQASGVNRP